MPAFPTVTDTLNGRKGTVHEAGPNGFTVVWSTGHSVGYTAADILSGRFLFVITNQGATQ